LDVTSLTKVTMGAGLQLSLAIRLPGLGAGTRLAQETVILVGHVIVGGVGSITVIDCVQVAELLQISVAR
jgi:hypothetical protein